MDSRSLVKATPKPLLLKDYLLDDLSSCSSSGFRAYPRRQCCTTVRFLLEVDMKNKQAMYKKKPPKLIKNQAKSQSSSTISAFQKASEALINAVKHFSFTTVKSSTSSSRQNETKLTSLPRSLSRKLLKKSFWKKNDHKEIEPWKPSVEEKSEPLMMRKDTTIVDSTSSTSESNSKKSDSWSDSDFTITTSDDSSSNFNSSERKNDVVLREKDMVSGKRVNVTVGDDCDSMDATTSNNSNSTNSTNSKKAWTNEEEKEQFSPVSVLDCPFDDEDDEVSSPFRHRLARVEGTSKKLMKKLQRFELLAQLEPLNLEKRIALSESDHKSVECPEHNASESDQDNFMLDVEEEEECNEAEEKPLKLLQLIKATMPSYSSKLEADNLLLDFFRERVSDGCGESKNLTGDSAVDNELLCAAKDWINGQNREFLLEWEVQKNRQAYIRDMEKTGEWKTLDEEIKEVALEFEVEIFASLMNDLLDDLLPSLKTL